MKPRSPLTDISSSELCSIIGIRLNSFNCYAKRGAPCKLVKLAHRPFLQYRVNLYSFLGWLKNKRDSALRKLELAEGHERKGLRTSVTAAEKRIDRLETYIASYKSSVLHPEPSVKNTPTKNTPTMTTTPAPPKPFRQYPADRRMLTGDSVWTTLFFGRTNGVDHELLHRTATVTKDEDNFGCVLVRFGTDTATHSIPVCNLLLLRAVEDIPVLSIIADQFAFYITTKGIPEAVAAFWYGGKTGRLKDDARALAELNLDLLKKENA